MVMMYFFGRADMVTGCCCCCCCCWNGAGWALWPRVLAMPELRLWQFRCCTAICWLVSLHCCPRWVLCGFSLTCGTATSSASSNLATAMMLCRGPQRHVMSHHVGRTVGE